MLITHIITCIITNITNNADNYYYHLSITNNAAIIITNINLSYYTIALIVYHSIDRTAT